MPDIIEKTLFVAQNSHLLQPLYIDSAFNDLLDTSYTETENSILRSLEVICNNMERNDSFYKFIFRLVLMFSRNKNSGETDTSKRRRDELATLIFQLNIDPIIVSLVYCFLISGVYLGGEEYPWNREKTTDIKNYQLLREQNTFIERKDFLHRVYPHNIPIDKRDEDGISYLGYNLNEVPFFEEPEFLASVKTVLDNLKILNIPHWVLNSVCRLLLYCHHTRYASAVQIRDPRPVESRQGFTRIAPRSTIDFPIMIQDRDNCNPHHPCRLEGVNSQHSPNVSNMSANSQTGSVILRDLDSNMTAPVEQLLFTFPLIESTIPHFLVGIISPEVFFEVSEDPPFYALIILEITVDLLISSGNMRHDLVPYITHYPTLGRLYQLLARTTCEMGDESSELFILTEIKIRLITKLLNESFYDDTPLLISYAHFLITSLYTSARAIGSFFSSKKNDGRGLWLVDGDICDDIFDGSARVSVNTRRILWSRNLQLLLNCFLCVLNSRSFVNYTAWFLLDREGLFEDGCQLEMNMDIDIHLIEEFFEERKYLSESSLWRTTEDDADFGEGIENSHHRDNFRKIPRKDAVILLNKLSTRGLDPMGTSNYNPCANRHLKILLYIGGTILRQYLSGSTKSRGRCDTIDHQKLLCTISRILSLVISSREIDVSTVKGKLVVSPHGLTTGAVSFARHKNVEGESRLNLTGARFRWNEEKSESNKIFLHSSFEILKAVICFTGNICYDCENWLNNTPEDSGNPREIHITILDGSLQLIREMVLISGKISVRISDYIHRVREFSTGPHEWSIVRDEFNHGLNATDTEDLLHHLVNIHNFTFQFDGCENSLLHIYKLANSLIDSLLFNCNISEMDLNTDVRRNTNRRDLRHSSSLIRANQKTNTKSSIMQLIRKVIGIFGLPVLSAQYSHLILTSPHILEEVRKLLERDVEGTVCRRVIDVLTPGLLLPLITMCSIDITEYDNFSKTLRMIQQWNSQFLCEKKLFRGVREISSDRDLSRIQPINTRHILISEISLYYLRTCTPVPLPIIYGMEDVIEDLDALNSICDPLERSRFLLSFFLNTADTLDRFTEMKRIGKIEAVLETISSLNNIYALSLRTILQHTGIAPSMIPLSIPFNFSGLAESNADLVDTECHEMWSHILGYTGCIGSPESISYLEDILRRPDISVDSPARIITFSCIFIKHAVDSDSIHNRLRHSNMMNLYITDMFTSLLTRKLGTIPETGTQESFREIFSLHEKAITLVEDSPMTSNRVPKDSPFASTVESGQYFINFLARSHSQSVALRCLFVLWGAIHRRTEDESVRRNESNYELKSTLPGSRDFPGEEDRKSISGDSGSNKKIQDTFHSLASIHAYNLKIYLALFRNLKSQNREFLSFVKLCEILMKNKPLWMNRVLRESVKTFLGSRNKGSDALIASDPIDNDPLINISTSFLDKVESVDTQNS